MGYKDISVIVISYLLGCFNTGYYYVRLFYKKDVRTVGTNVTGAYNVSKISGKKGFVITFAGDALKGAMAVVLCRLLRSTDDTTLLCIFMVLAGHIFPFQLKFKGGKGLSTAFGAFLIFNPILIVYWLISCLAFFFLIRKYTITCLFALAILPLELFVGGYPWPMIFFFLSYAILIIYACRGNFKEYIKTRAYQGLKKNDKTDL